jgi:ribonuclease HII
MEKKYDYEIGIDEAGRGCLAGPVVAACFLVTPDFVPHKYLNDSKQMTEAQRSEVYHYLKENYFECGSVGVISNEIIDEVNILQATFKAMHESLDTNPSIHQRKGIRIIVDGDKFKPYYGFEHECIPKADATYYSVAAASVLAKVTRDHLMIGLHAKERYNCYNFAKHKGYATPEHYALIEKYGASDVHRKSFRLFANKSVTLF